MAINSVNETAISLPFVINSYGKVQTTIDQKKIWADRVYSVIGTLLSERVMRPNFGSDAAKELLSTTEKMTATVDSSVRLAFINFLPLLTLQEIESNYDFSSNVLTIDLTYSLPNQEVVYSNIGFAQLSGNNPIYEENL
jgi:phage baseplate assembly protein W